MTFAHSAHRAIWAPNVAAGERLQLNPNVERNAHKFKIAACAACDYKRATVSVGP
jgi:hypothetical protein